VSVVLFIIKLFSGDLNFFSINNYNIVTTIGMGRERSLIFASDAVSDFCS